MINLYYDVNGNIVAYNQGLTADTEDAPDGTSTLTVDDSVAPSIFDNNGNLLASVNVTNGTIVTG